MSEKTATIRVKFNKTDPVYQEVLIREGEYYHPQFHKWFALPERWKEKAAEALATAEN